MIDPNGKWWAPLISRKFIVALGSLASAHWLCSERLIADGVYSAVVMGTAGAYMLANVTQKVQTKDKKDTT